MVLESVAITPGLLPPHSFIGSLSGTVTWKVGHFRRSVFNIQVSLRDTSLPAASHGGTWGRLHRLHRARESR